MMLTPCTLPPKAHSHSQDRRYCYWRSPTQQSYWWVRDRITARTVKCKSRRAVVVWIKAAQAFAPSFEALGAKKEDNPCR